MTEAFLQYVWQHQLLEVPLFTVDGSPVKILRPGMLNADAGPDFFDARISVGDALWVGNVEVHIKSSDWMRHRHSSDKSYNNVILHVVYEHDVDILAENGVCVPTLEVRRVLPDVVWSNYEALMDPPDALCVPCKDALSDIPPLVRVEAMDNLLVERLQSKCAAVRRLLKESKGSWEHTCYWLLAHYFGGKTNAFPFELLAKNTDLKLLARWKDSLPRMEALLFGQAGMLEDSFKDTYPQSLKSDYEALRKGARLTPIPSHLWRFFRLRPSGFPTIRISQFAQMLSKYDNFFAHLLPMSDVDDLRSFFCVEASDYWSSHYQFDKPSASKVKSSGRMFADNIIVNVWVPLLFEYANQQDEEAVRCRAIDILSQLPPENNNVVRQWSGTALSATDAGQSQALIQLYGEYCSHRRCLQCRFGHYFLKRNFYYDSK